MHPVRNPGAPESLDPSHSLCIDRPSFRRWNIAMTPRCRPTQFAWPWPAPTPLACRAVISHFHAGDPAVPSPGHERCHRMLCASPRRTCLLDRTPLCRNCISHAPRSLEWRFVILKTVVCMLCLDWTFSKMFACACECDQPVQPAVCRTCGRAGTTTATKTCMTYVDSSMLRLCYLMCA